MKRNWELPCNIQISGGYSVARSQSVWKARCFLVFYVQGVENDRRKSFTKRVIFTPVDITIYTEGRNVLVSACIKWIVAKSSQNLAKKWISLFFQPEMKSCCSYWWLSFFLQIEGKGRVCGSGRMLFVFSLLVRSYSWKKVNLLGGAVIWELLMIEYQSWAFLEPKSPPRKQLETPSCLCFAFFCVRTRFWQPTFHWNLSSWHSSGDHGPRWWTSSW